MGEESGRGEPDMIHRILAAGALCAAAITPSFAAAPATGIKPGAAVTQEGEYLRIRTVTVVRNFPDGNGSALHTIPAGTLVRGYRTSEGKPAYREVEVAGGFPVWVFGQYLQPTDVEGVLLVTGSRVNMRPSPELSPSSMALRSKLDAGQRVKLIKRGGDWIQVQAPPGARAWIVADAVTKADPGTGAAQWAQANPPLPTRSTRNVSAGSGNAGATRSASAPVVPTVSAAVLRSLAEADRAFDAANALRSPTTEAWRDVVLAYESVVAQAPAGSITRQNAAARLDRARLKMEAASIREDFNADSRKREEEINKINVYLGEIEKRKSAHWGRFQARGWVDGRTIGGEKHWFLIFGGATVAEIRCETARYDLSVFEDFEIGVYGVEIAAGVRSSASTYAQARVVDIRRIEVISGSSIRR